MFLFKRLVILIILIFTINFSYGQPTVTVNYTTTGLSAGNTITVPVVFNSPGVDVANWQVLIYYNRDVLTYNSILFHSQWVGGFGTNVFSTYTLPTTPVASPQYPGQTCLKVGFNGSSNGSVHFPCNNLVAFTITFTYNGGNTNLEVINQNLTAGGTSAFSSYIKNLNVINTSTVWTNGSASGNKVDITSVAGGGNWTSTSSWDLGHVPNTSNGKVIINSDPSTPLLLDANTTFTGDLTINSSKALTINSGKSLTLSGNFLIKSDVSGTGSFINYGSYTAANTTVERFLPAWPSSASTQGWHQISSPVSSHSLVNFTPSPANTYDFFKWSEPTLTWLDQKLPVNGITAFQSGIGYLVSYQNSGNHDFTGTLINSNVSPALTYTPGSDPCVGCNLIGNPFTSAINGDITAAGWNRVNVNDYIEVWDDASGNYLTWNGVTGSLTNGIVPAMQGFWVKTNGSSPSITIPLTARTHSSQNLYKSSSLNDQISLKVQCENGLSDNVNIYFSNTANNSLDEAIDVPKLFGSVQEAPQLYSYIGSNKYSINAMGSFTSVTIPLGFEPRVNGYFFIKAAELSSFAPGTTIYLQDLKTGTITDLLLDDTYFFNANTSDNVNRFNLLFNTTVGISDNNTSLANNIYSYGKDIFVDCGEAKVKQISIYNTIGQLIYSVNNTTGMFKYTLNGDNTTGYYIVKVITDKNVNSEKVFVK